MAWRGKRGFRRSPYHYDDRYGTRERLSDLNWQRGVLSKEDDTLLIGDREVLVMQALQACPEEAQPDEKLQTPDVIQDDIIMP